MAPKAWTTKEVEAALRGQCEGRHRVAPGLYLRIEAPKPGEGGRASWSFRYQINGRSRIMGLGAVGDVTLAAARRKAEEALLLVRGGADPLTLREQRAREAAAAALAARMPSFREAAQQHIESQQAGWRNEKHAAQWAATLETYAYPHFGDVPVDRIDTDHVRAALNPIWTTKPETASRVRGRIEAVLDSAKVRGWRSGENPARWKGHLALLLPKKAKVQAVEHHAALDWRDLPAFWGALAARGGAAALALRFAILTAARSGEVLGATWAEIDTVQRLWTIPAARMKAGREHRVPLSDAALAVLAEARAAGDGEGDARVFAGRGSGGGLSSMAITMMLRKMKRPGTKKPWTDAAGETVTAHGFRSTFRDWAGEATHHPREVIEQALAHGLKDKAEAAYARGDLLTKRATLMAEWATYCTRPAGAVLPMHKAAAQ
ncbi:tyrosine-type recombinase/integrase [Neoroseomonas lacus]|uniref:Bacteriophage P4 integrase n=1 Tax=Neoroseomonas lacus TaxID=287609 RepID=A0A917NNF6_9PROT|nr:site-specific integrase [Neoroseomonas lacus]GGJ10868.1 bacteriophage P4 integrase [Neoroseomonas lacus]